MEEGKLNQFASRSESVGADGTKEMKPTQGGQTVSQGEDKVITEEVWSSEDWRRKIIGYLENPRCNSDKKEHRLALKYTMINGELYRCTLDGILLKCLGEEKTKLATGEVHGGICQAHQSTPKKKRVLRRTGLYWPMMMDDCVWYKKVCEMCQKFAT
jgi:hypothetical protein